MSFIKEQCKKRLKALTLGVSFLPSIMYNRGILFQEAFYEEHLYG
jgi:hypothetical protein